ncbi:MAG: stage II sporulation protein M [archaeon]
MRRNFFARNYGKCWNFFRELRWYMVFALGIFGLMFLVGFAYPVFFREEIFKFLAGMVDALEGKSVVELIVYIFLNNLKAGFVAIVSGVVVGIFPFVIGVVNGYLVGFVAKEAVMQEGIAVLWQLAPHGIFELPAILLSIGIGFKIGTSVFAGRKSVKYNFVEGLRFFVFVILPLLLVAGIIEGILIGILG